MSNTEINQSTDRVICLVASEGIDALKIPRTGNKLEAIVKSCFFIPVTIDSEQNVGFVSKAWIDKKTGGIMGNLVLISPVSEYLFVSHIDNTDNNYIRVSKVDGFIPKPCFIKV